MPENSSPDTVYSCLLISLTLSLSLQQILGLTSLPKNASTIISAALEVAVAVLLCNITVILHYGVACTPLPLPFFS